MRPPRSIPLLLLVAAPAFAQTASLGEVDPSRGLTRPPTGAALTDDATSLGVNPSALTSVGEGQLIYMHERSEAASLVGDGLYLGWTPFDVFGLGLSVEWLRGTQLLSTSSYRKTAFGLSLGTPELSLGAAFNFFNAPSGADLNGLTSVDLGLSSRLTRFLSVGAVVHNVDAQANGLIAFERKYDLGVGLRPFGERYSVGADFLWGENLGPDHGRMSYTLQAEVLRGIVLGAGFSHGFHSGDDTTFQLALTVNAPHAGATIAGAAAQSGWDGIVQARASLDSYRSVSLSNGTVALADLSQMLTSSGGGVLSLLGVASKDPYLETIEELDKAARDPRLTGLVLKIDSLPGGLGHVDELRQAVVRLRANGKRVVALLLNGGDREYLLASACDKIYAVPQGVLAINGFTASVLFFGEGMDKLGLDWKVARVGQYKNAPDQFTRSDMSDEQREAIDAYLDSDVRHFEEAVTQTRQIPAKQIEAAWKEGLLSPKRALELGLIDGVVGPKELEDKLGEMLPGARYDPDFEPLGERKDRWGSLPKIAVVPIVGQIAGGKSGEDPLGLQHTAGADSIIRALKSAEEDSSIEAVVLWVDSPGGDGLASDLIYREILELKKKKPVVAAMGDVAASGGYYVAMGANEIWAEPTTITGSIGVFVLLPAWERLGDKLGVHEETIKRGELADMLGLHEQWTDAERAAAQRWVDSFYDDFITEVSRSRAPLSDKAAVDHIARGRVWSGVDAQKRGLVDNLGGILEAIDSAKVKAGLPESAEVELQVMMGNSGALSSLAAQSRFASLLGGHVQDRPLPEGLTRLARELGLADAFIRQPGIMAMMPYSIRVE